MMAPTQPTLPSIDAGSTDPKKRREKNPSVLVRIDADVLAEIDRFAAAITANRSTVLRMSIDRGFPIVVQSLGGTAPTKRLTTPADRHAEHEALLHAQREKRLAEEAAQERRRQELRNKRAKKLPGDRHGTDVMRAKNAKKKPVSRKAAKPAKVRGKHGPAPKRSVKARRK